MNSKQLNEILGSFERKKGHNQHINTQLMLAKIIRTKLLEEETGKKGDETNVLQFSKFFR